MPSIEKVFSKSDLKYNYPEGLDLRPGRPTHDKIRDRLRQMARASHDKISKRHDVWNKLDKTTKAFIKLNEKESQWKQDDDRRPIQVVVPMTAVAADTLLTYFSSALLQLPYHRFQGSGPEDTVGALLLEKVIQSQNLKFKAGLSHHTVFRDSILYGIGGGAVRWEKKMGFRRVEQPVMDIGFLGKSLSLGSRTTRERAVLCEGNIVDNIDPYTMLPDPNVPIHRAQDGEYFGWVERTSFTNLLEREHTSDGRVFNVKFLAAKTRRLTSRFSGIRETGREDFKDDLPDSLVDHSRIVERNVTKPVDTVHFYVNLIPAEWELGSSKIPEKWIIGLSGDEVITEAVKMDLDHGMYPIAISAPDFDGYSVTPTSKLEIGYGLQEAADFMFNSHNANVRKAVNDVLIIDPFALNLKDFENPEPGKVIRTRQPAWGKGVDGFVKQLAISDITQNNIRDMGVIQNIHNLVSGAGDNVAGGIKVAGERISADQSRAARSGQASRMERMIMLTNMQYMHDMALIQAAHTQQFMSQDMYVNIVGEHQRILEQEYGGPITGNKAKVTPFDINVIYDIMPVDNTIKGGEFAEIWVQAFQAAQQNQEVASVIDMPKVFLHMMKLMGAENIYDFVRQGGQTPQLQPQVMPDDQVEGQVDAGNLVPLGGGGAY